MTDQPPPATTVGMLSHLSEKLVAALPPAFLLLVILNIVFIGVNGWIFIHNTDNRSAMLTKIIDACLVRNP